MVKEKILIVDDEEDIRALILTYMSKEGFQALQAPCGSEALILARNERPDLIILDVMLPDMDGLEVCRQLRNDLAMPIIFLSAKSEEFDKVLGLSLGGDDYLTKPFSPRELVARVKAILRRSGGAAQPSQTEFSHVLRFDKLVIDIRGYEVTFNKEQIVLPGKEFELFAFLALNANNVFSREQLYQNVWGTDAMGDSRTVLVHIRHLREKFQYYPELADCIKTVWGIGYKFSLDI